jgi:V/A-type H+-transporting ATPase subunit I
VSFLRPVEMARVGIIGLKEDQERLVTVLHDLGVVQIEPIGPEALEFVDPERASDVQRAIGDQLVRFRGLASALPRKPIGAPRHFANRQEILDAARAVTIDEDVGRLKRLEDAAITRQKSLQDTIALLERFSFFPERLDYLTAAHVLSFFGEASPEVYQRLRTEIPALADAMFFDHAYPDGVRFIAVVRTEQGEAIGRLAQQNGVTLTAVPNVTGTIEEILPRLGVDLEELEGQLRRTRGLLDSISETWYGTVAALEEAFAIEARKLDVYTKLGTQANTFVLEGWVPRRSRPRLVSAVEAAAGGRACVYDAPAHEEPPTLMDNPPGVRFYEFFIRFYSLPQSTEWDPTWIFAIAFPLFFGFMLGDWGYGLTILLISIWMIEGFPGGQHLPKGLRNFVKMIMGPKSMQQLAYALIPGCFVAIAFGLYSDSFFGQSLFAAYGYPGFSYQAHVAILLGVAVIFGVVMVTLGFGLGALHEYYRHHTRAAIGKVGGVIAAVGVFGIFAPILSAGTGIFPTGAIATYGFIGAILFGVLLLIFGEGVQMGAIGALEVISHVLSYARLVGILLASAVLAFLINYFAHGLLLSSGPVAAVFILLGIVLLVFGQVFNLVLGVFEPGIQGARLIFVEHFSKYYEGNGHAFTPFGSARTHTLAAPVGTPPPP